MGMRCAIFSGSAGAHSHESCSFLVSGESPSNGCPAYVVVYVQSNGFVGAVFGIGSAEPGSVLILSSDSEINVVHGMSYRLLSHASAYPTLTPPSPSVSSPFFTQSSASLAENAYFQPLPRCSRTKWLFPNGISGNANPSFDCKASHSPAFEIGLVEAVMSQSLISIERELGDS